MGWGEERGHVGGASTARLHLVGHLTPQLTLREAAELHLAGELLRRRGLGGTALANGVDALRRALEAAGAHLDDHGWTA